MYDHETGSYWHQTSGTALVGELSGASMEPLPSLIATYGEWKGLHPHTFVLSNSFEQARRVRDSLSQVQNAVDDERFFFPVTDNVTSDKRLNLGAEVLMVRVSGALKAYALDDVRRAPANDRVAGLPLVVFGTSQDAMAAYVARIDGRELTFDAGDDGTFADRETRSTWNLGGPGRRGGTRRKQTDAAACKPRSVVLNRWSQSRRTAVRSVGGATAMPCGSPPVMSRPRRRYMRGRPMPARPRLFILPEANCFIIFCICLN
jgi:hypothetical protein